MRKYGTRGNPRAAFGKFVRIDVSGCHIWTGSTSGIKAGGYGGFWFEGRMHRAHRVAWQFVHGAIPDGVVVCHRCDTPLCVNPDHLFLGTQIENIADMVRKGRQQRVPRPGELNTQAKLSVTDIPVIRRMAATGASNVEIGRCYGLSNEQISRIVRRKRWASVP